ncbi:MAG: homoserine dehydrogenase, partial [Actinomycetales bacterium]|nr:homoserine dehydrogenase [Actinomycetales bacterium]
VANIFSAHDVSIETVEQMANVVNGKRTGTASLEIGTHRATDAALSAVVEALRATDSVVNITSVIRVEGV